MPGQHAKIFRPSAAKRLVECPISAMLSLDMPEEEDTPFTREGTLGHDVAEWYTEDIMNGDPFRRITDPKYTKEMKKHGKTYAKYVHATVAPYLHLKHAWFIEQKVAHSDEFWGTIDFIFMYIDARGEKHIIIIDYKYGQGVKVVSKKNWQTISYARCALTQYEGKSKKPFATVETHIVQPRIDHDGLEPQKYTVEELENEYFPTLHAVIDLINSWLREKEISPEDFAKYQRVGDHCDDCFCPARKICNPYIEAKGGKHSLKLFKKTVYRIEKKIGKKVTQPLLGNEELLTNAGIIDPEDLAFIALNAGYIKKLADGAKEVAVKLAKDGFTFETVKLVAGEGQRCYINDEKKVIKGLIKAGIENPVETKTTTSIISMSRAEELLGKGKIDHLLTRGSEPSYKLVAADAPGEAYKPERRTAKMFEKLVNAKKGTK